MITERKALQMVPAVMAVTEITVDTTMTVNVVHVVLVSVETTKVVNVRTVLLHIIVIMPMANAGIDTVGKGEVNNTVFTAEGNGGLGHVTGQSVQTTALSAGK